MLRLVAASLSYTYGLSWHMVSMIEAAVVVSFFAAGEHARA